MIEEALFIKALRKAGVILDVAFLGIPFYSDHMYHKSVKNRGEIEELNERRLRLRFYIRMNFYFSIGLFLLFM